MNGGDDDKDGKGGMRNVILGILAGAAGIIAIKLLIRWVNGEI